MAVVPSKRKGDAWRARMKSSLQYWAGQVEQLLDLFLSFKTSNPQSVPSHYPTVSENTRCLRIETIDVFGAFLEAARPLVSHS